VSNFPLDFSYDPSYVPTEDDIQTYKEDQAKRGLENEPCQHTWTEDGATFTVIDNPHTPRPPHLVGWRFTGGIVSSNEAVLAREILYLSKCNKRMRERVEKVIDILLHETGSSQRVEQAYRMLERMMTDNVTKNNTMKGEVK